MYYRFGFNGQEKVNEIAGIGNHTTALFWEYDTRIARRWNIDPVVKPWESPYSVFSSNPIYFVDPKGDDARVHKQPNENGKGGNITISTKVHAQGGTANERAEFVRNGNSQVDLMRKAGKMDGSYKDENGNTWGISLNIQYVDEGTVFEDGDNVMDLSKLNNTSTSRSSVFARDLRNTKNENGRQVIADGYERLNITGNQGEMRGGINGLNGYAIYHETMHFMGLSDRYETTSGRAHAGYSNDIMAYNGDGFNQTHWNNWGKAVLDKPDSKFILRNRVDIQGTVQKVMMPEGYPTTNGSK